MNVTGEGDKDNRHDEEYTKTLRRQTAKHFNGKHNKVYKPVVINMKTPPSVRFNLADQTMLSY